MARTLSQVGSTGVAISIFQGWSALGDLGVAPGSAHAGGRLDRDYFGAGLSRRRLVGDRVARAATDQGTGQRTTGSHGSGLFTVHDLFCDRDRAHGPGRSVGEPQGYDCSVYQLVV